MTNEEKLQVALLALRICAQGNASQIAKEALALIEEYSEIPASGCAVNVCSDCSCGKAAMLENK